MIALSRHAATAAGAGVPLHCIDAHTGPIDIAVLVNRYIRPLEAFVTTRAKGFGWWRAVALPDGG